MKINLRENIKAGMEKFAAIKTAQNRKPALKKVAFVIVVVAGLLIYSTYANSFRFKGQVESLVVPIISEVPGKLIESDISLGQNVKKGDVLARFDSADLGYTLAQLELNLQKKKLALGEATVGQGGQATNSYLAAQSNYQSASIAAAKALQDYTNAKTLYAEGAISGTELESAKVRLASAEGLASTSLAQLNNALSQSGETGAQIDIAILESQISQTKDILAKYTLTAPCDGIILSRNYSEGSLVSAGYNIADIGSLEETYVVFYVSESKLDSIQYNDELQVKAGGESIFCTVKYIDAKSQYTPRELQTVANKGKTNFKVKLLVPPSSALKPGMEVTVILK